jgi:uncharacterized membrane protein
VPARLLGALPHHRPGHTRGVDRSQRTELAAVLLVYVLPLGAAVGFLVVVGLWQLALALAAVEAVVFSAVLWARRTPGG